MNNGKLAELAEMEGTKKDAPGPVAAGRGRGGDSRQGYSTTFAGADQEHHSQPAAVQRARLLGMLRRGPVTTLEARAVAIMSPATRIFELKRQGHRIVTTRLPNRVGVYHLVAEAGHGDD